MYHKALILDYLQYGHQVGMYSPTRWHVAPFRLPPSASLAILHHIELCISSPTLQMLAQLGECWLFPPR